MPTASQIPQTVNAIAQSYISTAALTVLMFVCPGTSVTITHPLQFTTKWDVEGK